MEQIKIKSNSDFDFTNLSFKLKAPNSNYIRDIFKEKDPKELVIAMNEFAYSISNECSNMSYACYWLEWILEFDSICKKKKNNTNCEIRAYNVETKYRNHIIWLIWDIFIHYNNLTNNKINEKIITSILKLFCIKFTDATPKRRRYLLYFTISLFTEKFDLNTSILPNKKLLSDITENIETIYKQIKSKEISPKTDYLFKGIDKRKQIERSLKQLEMINSIETNKSDK